MRRFLSAAAATSLIGVVLTLPSLATAQSRDIGPQAAPRLEAAASYADSWAVVVGIDNYQHPRIPKLRYAVNDARAIRQAVLALGFKPERVLTLFDAQATKAAIEGLIADELRSRLAADHRVLVFFAGHGKTDRLRSGEEEGYLLPADADPARLFSTAIGMTALRQMSDRIPAKHILYIVDACYSGYALFNRSISEDLLEEMLRKPAIQILTAGRQQDQAQEFGGHGVFTHVLLRALHGDAFSGKPWLALEELGVWVKQRVYAESNRKQLPQFGNLAGEGQFVFFRPGGPASIQSRPPRVTEPTVSPPLPPQPSQPLAGTPTGPALAALPVPIINIPPGQRPEYPLIALNFVGVGPDKVGRGFMSTPNREPDGHFRLLIDAGTDRFDLMGIELYTSDARGRRVFATHPGQAWGTFGTGWFLGVEREGRRLNPSDRTIRDSLRGRVLYELYADGGEWFTPDQYFTVVVKFADGTERALSIRPQ